MTPCKLVGGNDYVYCKECGLEYDYRKVEMPACPRQKAALTAPQRRDKMADRRSTAGDDGEKRDVASTD